MASYSSPYLLRTLQNHPGLFMHLLAKKFRFAHRRNLADKCDLNKDTMPLGYGIKITNRCNLRCSICFEWSKQGYHHRYDRDEKDADLDWDICKKVIEESAPTRPFYNIWGGEPFLYPHLTEFVRLAAEKNCYVYVCTNGTFLSDFKDVIARQKNLSLLVSLDGFEPEHDAIRGRGMFKKTRDGIKQLKKTPGKMPYIGVEFTILPSNVHYLYEFCREMAKLGIDWLLLNNYWFISDSQARQYENFMQENFNILPKSHLGYLDMDFDLNRDEFIRQHARIEAEKSSFPLSIRWQPNFRTSCMINTFLDTPEIPTTDPVCYKIWIKCDIIPPGKIVACQHFPDLLLGDLRHQTIHEIWNSTLSRRFRSVIRENLMPVCSKCDSLSWYSRNP